MNMCQAAKRQGTSITEAGAKLLRRYFADYGIPANQLANMVDCDFRHWARSITNYGCDPIADYGINRGALPSTNYVGDIRDSDSDSDFVPESKEDTDDEEAKQPPDEDDFEWKKNPVSPEELISQKAGSPTIAWETCGTDLQDGSAQISTGAAAKSM
ncbi:hypothetical protein PHYSODRAFT_325362 [Phytophthora sojae]|uniref:Uncharacterized protein n=1 Tax=Phytophthora sojae (strain P6497) TaxID=1094619 RepID=G4YSV0_PHYSP|nr:hypothetical protein PHYSODRAFT_325362 [Phytophthora sojae]EGZ24222.1 hypothetical protein PHYSODRAFT_325362 [Phytophthora sojae]|eukprot:XP_009519510.1 hypothetical protein PHYSODRAFT_325362 [Phytophthora sojae]